MAQSTTIIYLTGKPGVGKYTIAKDLAAKHGFIVCDNQLINNPIFELLQYDGYAKIPDFAWNTIARIKNVSNLSPQDAAEAIMNHIKRLSQR